MQTLQEYKCPCCGGAIAFDSTLQKMKCPYCDTEFDIETLAGYGKPLPAASGRTAKRTDCAPMCANPAAAK